MKLLRYGKRGSERPAIMDRGGMVHDVSAVTEDFDRAFFGAGGLDRLRTHVQSSELGEAIRVHAGMRIGAPVAQPGKVICVGLNYADHARESGMALAAEPTLFSKASNTVVGPNDDVLLPPRAAKGDWEVELAIVIGSQARYLDSPDEAAQRIAGYAISNDVSEREYQLERGGQWVKGKSCETFNPLGPWLVTPDEVGDVSELDLSLTLNGETMQASSTSGMVFGPDHLVWYISQFMVLDPGDVINTGTPAGVGLGMQPQRFLREGDVMELTITGLGTQRQRVRRASA